MNISLSQRVQRIKPSPTMAVAAKAAALRAQGKDIIALGAGEPDFDTPVHIKQAAIQAINNGLTKYTAVDGMPTLKHAIVEKFRRENRLEYSDQQITVSCGAKHSLYNLFQAILGPGDELIIPAPYWVSYPDMARLAGADPVTIETGVETGFKLSPKQLGDALNEKTRMLILNSPSNPTGACYSRSELAAFGAVLRDYPSVLIVTDDIYEHILWGGQGFVNIVNACPELYERCIVVNGVSKAYSMTGWRIGYAAGPELLIKAINKIQSQSTSNPCSIAQAAAMAALNGEPDCVVQATKTFKQRHDFVFEALRTLAGVNCLPSDGTFYIFPEVGAVINGLAGVNNDIELAAFLLEQAGVAVVPGSAFGAPNHLRISFATSMENLETGMERIVRVLSDG